MGSVISPLAGRLPLESLQADIPKLLAVYMDLRPDIAVDRNKGGRHIHL
jgi:hypothetical protein